MMSKQLALFGDNEPEQAQPSSTGVTLAEHLNHGTGRPGVMHSLPAVDGLYYIPEFLSTTEERSAIAMIDSSPEQWRGDLSRRVQHYGWRYDYRTRTVSADMRIGPLPNWLQEIAKRLHAETGLFDRVPDQAIVNEYEPGQGIAMHADRQCFGPSVATVSLGDAWEMDFRQLRDRGAAVRCMMLETRSAVILSGAARADWAHGIAKRRTEGRGSARRARRRRLSLTFRTMVGFD